ncbi:MAG: 16S rRNA (adenine(1518)-N(6)/adenine(1519)-N(6))-dimethyltransferase RsmA, partial [Alphaproteobacteria bacterium]|nr:16S rRNA (adenine(1518)-N(6)/adenine(1519)-N(6))-dimethyltransferase RsmA [Alphaproteobacteria bacterium]
MLENLPSLKATINAYGLAARKNLGQHFLLDEGLCSRIAAFAGPMAGVHAVEIGPGPGGLTRALCRAHPESLTVIEMDERCVAALDLLKGPMGGRLHVIQGDALKVSLPETVLFPRKIVANLPYNVGTLMLVNWLHDIARLGPAAYQSLTLMFQKEVAERIVAEHGNKDYGRLSVLAQFLCECRWDLDLPPGAFSPPPKVASAVVTLTPRQKPLAEVSVENLELVVGKAFGQRRKMLRGALKGLAVEPELLLSQAGIEGTARAEQLDVPTLCHLAK